MEHHANMNLDTVKTLVFSIASIFAVEFMPLLTKGNIAFGLQVTISLLTIFYLIIKNYKQLKK